MGVRGGSLFPTLQCSLLLWGSSGNILNKISLELFSPPWTFLPFSKCSQLHSQLWTLSGCWSAAKGWELLVNTRPEGGIPIGGGANLWEKAAVFIWKGSSFKWKSAELRQISWGWLMVFCLTIWICWGFALPPRLWGEYSIVAMDTWSAFSPLCVLDCPQNCWSRLKFYPRMLVTHCQVSKLNSQLPHFLLHPYPDFPIHICKLQTSTPKYLQTPKEERRGRRRNKHSQQHTRRVGDTVNPAWPREDLTVLTLPL